ncbi:MAG: hypothetical protein WCC64_05880 [Aliidongia sp.]
MTRPRTLLVACLALLGPAGCTTLPHPFEDDKLSPHAPLLAMPDILGVVVEPVQGTQDETSHALAEAMAHALQDAELPASTSAGNTRSFHLAGIVQPGADASHLDINWSLRNAAGADIGNDTQQVPLPLADATLAGSMRGEAPKLAALIQESTPAEHQPTRRLLVRAVEGAPGDGASSLKRALVFLLQRSGTRLTDDPATADTVAVAGTVEARPGPPGQDHIKILWHVLTPDGREAGVIAQENDVPRAVVEGQWGDIAMAVADAAAPDILRVAETVPGGK